MTEKCGHDNLTVKWGDDRAYYDRENEIKVVDGEYATTKTGNWEARDGGWGTLDEEGSQWIIHLECDDCEKVFKSTTDNTGELTEQDRNLIRMVEEMRP